jgi:hypothetical protein
MLNELYAMAQSLERCRLKVLSRHERLKKNPNEDGFILGIAQDGSVSSVEYRGKDRMKACWKIDSGENGVSFPSFRLPGPLWIPDAADQNLVEKLVRLKREAVTDRLSLLEGILQRATFSPTASKARYLRKNLREFPAEVQPILADCPEEYSAITTLLERLTRSVSEEAFLKSLSGVGLQAFRAGKLPANGTLLLQGLLLGKWDDEQKRLVAAKTVVLLEPSGETDYEIAVTHPDMEAFVNAQLMQKLSRKSFAKGGKGARTETGIDSLRGGNAEIQTRLPDPNLPIIGVTKLMSMTSDSPCQTRYGLQESATFPVGKSTYQAMLDALNFLTSENRKGMTWRGVPNAEGKQDLLLVYLADKPDAAIRFADLFAESEEDAILAEGQFEAAAQKVCAAVEGDAAISPDSQLRVIAISARDKGRKQVSLSESLSVAEIFRAAEEWQQSAANRPSISIPLPPKKGETSRVAAPICPHPAALLKCFNIQWTNEGTKSVLIPDCELGQIYEVFLKQSAQSHNTAATLLALAVQRSGGLLLAVGNRQHGCGWAGLSDNARFASLAAVSALAILLFKTGYLKETFMAQAPYNIGRLLSLADQLHALYCKEVRGGSLPPQLFGNALMNTALQQPVTAMSLFSQRVLPYKAWADTVQTGDSVGLAKYFLKEMQAVSQKLKAAELPVTLTDAERAEMILGYLANSKSETSTDQ